MFKKTKIAAVTAAVLGVTGMAIAPSAHAVSVAEAGATGQVLIFPYYNVNNGFATSFNITNTTNQYKAVKMRFRESKTSNDVLDFNVYMSPHDVFTVGLQQTAAGGVKLVTTDNTCTHPAIPAGGVEFRDVYDSVVNSDMREGYLEVIEMGEIDENATVTNGTSTKLIASKGLLHDSSGKPADCGVIEKAWQEGKFIQGGAPSNTGAFGTASNVVNPKVPGYPNSAALGGATTSTAKWYGVAPAANTATVALGGTTTAVGLVNMLGALAPATGGLAGSSILIDTVNVAGFVAEPEALNDYTSNPQHYLSADQNFYLLPSLASGNSVKADNFKASTGAVVTGTWGTVARDFGLDDQNVLPRSSVPSGINPMPVAHALAVTSLSNQFFLTSGTATDWIVAAPMRKHGIFNEYKYMPAPATALTAVPTKAWVIGFAKGDSAAAQLTKLNANGYWAYQDATDVNALFTYYNREEAQDTPAAGDFSPPLTTPSVNIPFKREVNILALAVSGVTNSSVLGSNNAQTVNVATGFNEGWGTFSFSGYDLAGARFVDRTTPATATTLASSWVQDFNSTTASAGVFTPIAPALGAAKGAPLSGFAAARGGVNGQNLGEAFPHIIGRTR